MKLFLAILLAVPAVLSAAPPPADLTPLESLVVQDSGRRKPIGTFGHELLVKISGRDPVRTTDGDTYDGSAFAFSQLFATHDWSNDPIILISYRPLIEAIGLDPSRKRFSRK